MAIAITVQPSFPSIIVSDNPSQVIFNTYGFITSGDGDIRYYSKNNESGFLDKLSGLSIYYVTGISGALQYQIDNNHVAGGVTLVTNIDKSFTVSPNSGAVVIGKAVTDGQMYRSGNYIISGLFSNGKIIHVIRSGNYISGITDGFYIWSFNRNASSQLVSWTMQ